MSAHSIADFPIEQAEGAAPVFGVVARTARGRARLGAGLKGVLPSTFRSHASSWWQDEKAGLAIYRPEMEWRERKSVLAVTGVLYRNGGIDDLTGAGRAVERALLEDLLQRDVAALAAWRGEFALALWDGSRRRLLLARDALGQRNLFIHSDDDFHFWSTELGAFLDDPNFSCELDFESAYCYLACGRPPPWHTMARKIRRIPAAHVVWWEPGRPLSSQRYWTPLHEEPRKQGDDGTRATIAVALEEAVRIRLDRCGSQAILLSGGLDSSFIAATAAAKLGGDRIHAYTIEFAESYGKNETKHAQLMADACNIRHRSVPLHAREALPLLETTLQAEEPSSAWAAITHRHLLRAVREDGHTHLLSGLGSDEVFSGYRQMLDFYFRWRKQLTRWPAHESVDTFDALLWDETASRTNLYPGVARFFSDTDLQTQTLRHYRAWHYATHLQEFYRECRLIKPEAHVFEMMVAHECQHRIPDALFVDFEPVGRELGIRTAYPFLDPPLLELVSGLGPKSRYEYARRVWWNKTTLRKIAADRVPRSILSRLPRSYNAPFAEWMYEPVFARPVLARLARSRFWNAGLVRPDVLKRLLAAMKRERPTPRGKLPGWVNQLWILLTLSSWYDRYVERAR